MDKISKGRRSENMRRIKSSNTKPELQVNKLLRKLGYKFSTQSKQLPGKPDIYFPLLKKAIFIHGCFWHMHKGCVDYRIPKSNTVYWKTKLENNVKRDIRSRRKLNRLGWSAEFP